MINDYIQPTNNGTNQHWCKTCKVYTYAPTQHYKVHVEWLWALLTTEE